MAEANKKSTTFYALIILLAVIFSIAWGVGSQGFSTPSAGKGAQAAATVNGKEIPLQEFALSWANLADNYKRQMPSMPPEFLKQLLKPNDVLDNLVNEELLAQEAQRRGIEVSDAELRETLLTVPQFQKDGKFNPDIYRRMLRYEGKTDIDFERDLRRRLGGQKLLRMVESVGTVSSDELNARYQRSHNTANVTFVRFELPKYAAKMPAVKPGEVEAWAAKNEALLKSWYEKNTINFFQPEQLKARQILLRVGPEATAEQKADVRSKLEGLRKELEAGKDFGELARATSEDTETKEKGGELGWVERAALPVAVADATFALKPGELSRPIETAIGWYLVKVEEKRAPETKPFERVKAEIAKTVWQEQRGRMSARADAEKALAAVKKGKTLPQLYPTQTVKPGDEKKERPPEATQSGEFSASATAIPMLPPNPDLLKKVMALSAPGLIDEVVDVGDAVLVVQVHERKLPTAEAFETAKAQLREEAVRAKGFELREAFVKSLRQGAAVVPNTQAISSVTG